MGELSIDMAEIHKLIGQQALEILALRKQLQQLQQDTQEKQRDDLVRIAGDS